MTEFNTLPYPLIEYFYNRSIQNNLQNEKEGMKPDQKGPGVPDNIEDMIKNFRSNIVE